MDVAVSGSTGLIGRALVPALEAAGHRVIRLTRPSTEVRDGSGAATVAWDPADGTIDAAGLEGIDGVVHLGGVGIGDARWTSARKRDIVESRTLSTRFLARTVAGLVRPPRVFVSASAVGFYGDRGDEVITEASPPGGGFLSEVCVAWEEATPPAATAGIRVVTPRIGIVLDATGGVLRKLLTPFKLGLGGRLGSGRQYKSWIATPDVVGGITAALTDASLIGPVNLTAPNPVTNAEFTATFGRVLGRPTAIPTPLLPLRLRFGDELVQSLLLDGQRVAPRKLLDSGYAFAAPDLDGALRTVLGR
jgi:uncharacterized protein (TIGR01777 family)